MTARFIVIGLLIVSGLGVVADAAQLNRMRLRLRMGTQSPISKAGWWIRVDAAATKATQINLRFGTKPKEFVGEGTWQPSAAPEMDFPSEVRAENVIHIAADATPASAPASVCVFFQQQGVERLAFTGTADRQLNSNKKEDSCKP